MFGMDPRLMPVPARIMTVIIPVLFVVSISTGLYIKFEMQLGLSAICGKESA